ncbi:hypothetical protein GDO81_008303 [Engystomops pustulosus]|uniref:Secreted protein n=1 Tax=Engystomops pustulosus TaxID=76066 RepID=A0AAV7CEV9_ENGPU|nr:hypothetical protein GDO81_008303 [Engystomops pustulosus]
MPKYLYSLTCLFSTLSTVSGSIWSLLFHAKLTPISLVFDKFNFKLFIAYQSQNSATDVLYLSSPSFIRPTRIMLSAYFCTKHKL